MVSLFAVLAIYLPALMLPGPDFVAVVRATLVHGAMRGIRTAVGVALGLSIFATLSLVGLAALLAQAEWLAIAIRLIGGAYLVYLGVKLVRSAKSALQADLSSDDGAEGKGRGVLFGLSVTLTNPKAVVLFASVFATAVPASAPGWFLVLLVAVAGGAALAWYTLVALVLAGWALWVLEGARAGLKIEELRYGETPVTLYYTGVDGPDVVIAHGFAGSRQMMQGYALVLAQAGYTVHAFDFEGHGMHARPMGGDVTALDGTTQRLVAQTRAVIDRVAGDAPVSSVEGGYETLVQPQSQHRARLLRGISDRAVLGVVAGNQVDEIAVPRAHLSRFESARGVGLDHQESGALSLAPDEAALFALVAA